MSNSLDLPLHCEREATIRGNAEDIFAYMDDPKHLAAHMDKSSWMMGGGKLTIEQNDSNGKSADSVIRMGGRFLGLQLSLEEVVTLREPPFRKTWETIGNPKLLAIDNYRMGFEISKGQPDAHIKVFIDYSLPRRPIGHFLGLCFARIYARWCVSKMISDTQTHFAS